MIVSKQETSTFPADQSPYRLQAKLTISPGFLLIPVLHVFRMHLPRVIATLQQPIAQTSKQRHNHTAAASSTDQQQLQAAPFPRFLLPMFPAAFSSNSAHSQMFPS